MQAVFLNNKTCERVHPVRIRKDNPDAEPFYEGMDEPLREIHDIWIKQYLRVDGVYFPRIAFEANEDENIEFDSFKSVADRYSLEQRWHTFNSMERTFTPIRSLTRFSRYFPEPVNIL